MLITYTHLRKSKPKSNFYLYSLAGERSFLKFCNFLLRLLPCELSHERLIPQDLFDYSTGYTSKGEMIMQTFKKTASLYNYIFVDTNSTQY